MRDVVESGSKGIANGRGFYAYTPAQAKRWEQLFLKFNYDVRRLALKYLADAGDRKSGVRTGKRDNGSVASAEPMVEFGRIP
jgi:3-hydroxybutyryl-CoA dehydrogenase